MHSLLLAGLMTTLRHSLLGLWGAVHPPGAGIQVAHLLPQLGIPLGSAGSGLALLTWLYKRYKTSVTLSGGCSSK
jgi:hypothetical protein